ncbi:MAG: class II fumarate hydratase [Eubacteriaceae bacterium]|nr:class II fumarate hydratase [Eubacteriaceae bacterium]
MMAGKKDYRTVTDSIGEVRIEADKLWGAATQRALDDFSFLGERMPLEIVYAVAMIKKAAARANRELGVLPEKKAELIEKGCDEILSGALDDSFPLTIWQTGSGTFTNMNVNEVICGFAEKLDKSVRLDPNDDVNMSQSTNDVFPSAMHLASILLIEKKLLPALAAITEEFRLKAVEHKDTVKIGRTHLMDAVPISFGKEASGWQHIIETDTALIKQSLESLREIPLGGTAVGSGLNTPEGYSEKACRYLTEESGTSVVPMKDFYAGLSSKNAAAGAHAALRVLAGDLIKIANDIRFYSSGPLCGLKELNLPAREAGSSIMPGKVNPTQCEALIMVSQMVYGNDAAFGMAAMYGNFQLNVNMPLMAHLLVRSINLMSAAIESFTSLCLKDMKANTDIMRKNAQSALTLVTALNTKIGYKAAAEISKDALKRGVPLRDAALASGLITAEEFDETVKPEKMI